MTDSRLTKLLTINRGAPSQSTDRWRDVEESIHLQLPASYKQLVDLFGASRWADFLYVLSPFDEELNLRRIGNETLDADRISRQSFPWHYPLGLYPESGGLLPWAVTDNGDTFYFITSGPPDEWPTMIKGPRAPEFEVSFLPPALLVYHVAAGSIRSSILPES